MYILDVNWRGNKCIDSNDNEVQHIPFNLNNHRGVVNWYGYRVFQYDSKRKNIVKKEFKREQKLKLWWQRLTKPGNQHWQCSALSSC